MFILFNESLGLKTIFGTDDTVFVVGLLQHNELIVGVLVNEVLWEITDDVVTGGKFVCFMMLKDLWWLGCVDDDK